MHNLSCGSTCLISKVVTGLQNQDNLCKLPLESIQEVILWRWPAGLEASRRIVWCRYFLCAQLADNMPFDRILSEGNQGKYYLAWKCINIFMLWGQIKKKRWVCSSCSGDVCRVQWPFREVTIVVFFVLHVKKFTWRKVLNSVPRVKQVWRSVCVCVVMELV